MDGTITITPEISSRVYCPVIRKLVSDPLAKYLGAPDVPRNFESFGYPLTLSHIVTKLGNGKYYDLHSFARDVIHIIDLSIGNHINNHGKDSPFGDMSILLLGHFAKDFANAMTGTNAMTVTLGQVCHASATVATNIH